MSAARYQVAVLIALLAFAQVEAQDVSTAEVASAASAASAAAQPSTLWRFLGIPQGFQKVRDVVANRRGNRPRMERRDPIKRIADPANLESDNPAIKAAAEIKKAEDMKLQKIKAIKYLATIGCGCYDKDGKITEALIAATDDCTPDVREEALKAIDDASSRECCPKCGSTSCCNEKITKRLSEIAYERDDSGCPIEPNAEIRKLAKRILCKCCPGGPPSGPIEEDDPEPEPEPEPVPAPKPEPVDPPEPEVSGESSDEDDEVAGESSGDEIDSMDDFGDPGADQSTDEFESPFKDDPEDSGDLNFDSVDNVHPADDSPSSIRFHINDQASNTHPKLAPVVTAPKPLRDLSPVRTIRVQPRRIHVKSKPISLPGSSAPTHRPFDLGQSSGPSISDQTPAIAIAKVPQKMVPREPREVMTIPTTQVEHPRAPSTQPKSSDTETKTTVAQAVRLHVDRPTSTASTASAADRTSPPGPVRMNLLQTSSVEPVAVPARPVQVRPQPSPPSRASSSESRSASTSSIPKGMRRPILAEVISVNFDTGIVVLECDQTSLIRVAMRGSLYGGNAANRELLTQVTVVRADDRVRQSQGQRFIGGEWHSARRSCDLPLRRSDHCLVRANRYARGAIYSSVCCKTTRKLMSRDGA